MRTLPLLAIFLLGCGPQMQVPDAGGGGECRDLTKSPANLLENPGFECDSSPATWNKVYGALDFVAGGRSGRAAQVTVDASGGRFAYAKDFAVDAGTKTFCFTAWLKGTAPFMRMRMLRVLNGAVAEVNFNQQIFPDWRRIPTQFITNDNAPKLQLVFEVQTNRTDNQNAMPGQIMLIDDVDVWESSANCSEAR